MPPTPSQNQLITAVIDCAFNALLLEAFLCGLYTLLFGYTLQILLRKKNKTAYASVLTLLWVLVMLTFAFDWQYHRSAFVIHNDSPLDIAVAVEGRPDLLTILDNTLSFSCNWLADALVIWRCCMLWEHKKWALLPLPMLLVADIVLGIVSIIAPIKRPADERNFIFVIAFYAVSIAITFMGTGFIIFRILSVTRKSPLETHKSAYRNIQRIVVESGLIYTIALFITGVTLLKARTSITAGEFTTYTAALLGPVSGIAPTLIATRVGAETSTQTDDGLYGQRQPSRVLSHLRFRRTSRQNDAFDIGIDGVSSPGDSPTDSSIERADYRGRSEKIDPREVTL